MSRSYRKHPAGACTGAESEKEDKQSWHRRFRRKVRQYLHLPSLDEVVLPHAKEVSDPFDMAKVAKFRAHEDDPRFDKYRRK